jgi:hypothetical protein
MVTHRIVAYLISLAVGYWILTLAEKEKDHTKVIGRVIGWIIIVVSLCVSLCGPLCLAASAWCRHSSACCSYSASYCPMDNGCKMGMGASSMGQGQCPMGGKEMMKDSDKSGAKGMDKGPAANKGQAQ